LLFIIEFSRLSINPVSWSKPNFVDMESIISSANQYARDVERIDADNSVDSTDTSGLTRKERKDRKKNRLDITIASALPSLIKSIND
jgi:hypothetical protein